MKGVVGVLWGIAAIPGSVFAAEAAWFVRGQSHDCMPINRVTTLAPVAVLGIDGNAVDSPETLGAALRQKGISFVTSPIRPGAARIIEIRAPAGTFWLVLAPRTDCQRFVESLD